MRRGAVAALVLATVAAVAPARALPTAAGPSLTIDAPSTFSPGTPIRVQGHLVVAFGLPILVEVAQGVPDQQVEIVVDGEVAATTTTADDGSYRVDLTLGADPPATKMIQAVAYRGSAIETRSRVVHTTIDRILSDLTVTPSEVALSVGGEAQLLATGMWDDGRSEDLTGQVSWTSSDPEVATVDQGLVHAHTPGDATITATFRGRTATAEVTVSG